MKIGITKISLFVIYIILPQSYQHNSCILEKGQMPWKRPCGSGEVGPTPKTTVHDKEWMIHFVSVLEEINHKFSQLKAAYYGDSTVQKMMSKCGHLDADFYHLKGFPTADSYRIIHYHNGERIAHEVLEDYEKLSNLFVFVEQIVWDRDFFGERDEDDVLCTIYRKLQDLLCNLYVQIDKPSLDKLLPTLTRKVMRREYRTGDRISRMNRNYIIFKDASKYLGAIIYKYIRFYFEDKSKR